MTITIKTVIDGDTIITTDKEHIRLIGIDTPEIDHETNLNQAGAIEAKAFLFELLSQTEYAGVIFDEERKDQYGRTLGHLFLPDGTNIQSVILKQGWAVPLTYPPNVKFTDCYYHASSLAEKNLRGLWDLTTYRPVQSDNLAINETGFKIVTGKIENITESKYSLIMRMGQHLNLTIRKSDLKFFDLTDINTLLGNQIRVQGEIYYQNSKLWMRIRHPLDIKILSSADN